MEFLKTFKYTNGSWHTSLQLVMVCKRFVLCDNLQCFVVILQGVAISSVTLSHGTGQQTQSPLPR